jgi:hypothetical protein
VYRINMGGSTPIAFPALPYGTYNICGDANNQIDLTNSIANNSQNGISNSVSAVQLTLGNPKNGQPPACP